VIRKSRLGVALVLTVALGVSGIAFADGTSQNDAFVDGQVSKKKKPKLPKKKFKKVDFNTGVRTTTDSLAPGHPIPAEELIHFSKNIKFKLSKATPCTNVPGPGSTPSQARDACPGKSYLGSGTAEVKAPGTPPADFADDVTVTTFAGPGGNGIQLHTYSPTLGALAPTVQGFIVKSNAGRKYKQALSVPEAPVTPGGTMITQFDSDIRKKIGTVLARCKPKKFTWLREVTYSDSTTDTAKTTQKCKPKKKK
jgi:hypothetical protein